MKLTRKITIKVVKCNQTDEMLCFKKKPERTKLKVLGKKIMRDSDQSNYLQAIGLSRPHIYVEKENFGFFEQR